MCFLKRLNLPLRILINNEIIQTKGNLNQGTSLNKKKLIYE